MTALDRVADRMYDETSIFRGVKTGGGRTAIGEAAQTSEPSALL